MFSRFGLECLVGKLFRVGSGRVGSAQFGSDRSNRDYKPASRDGALAWLSLAIEFI